MAKNTHFPLKSVNWPFVTLFQRLTVHRPPAYLGSSAWAGYRGGDGGLRIFHTTGYQGFLLFCSNSQNSVTLSNSCL